MKIRSLNQQFKYAINQNIAIGHSKRAEKSDEKLYSVGRIEDLRDFSRQFAGWLNKEYPQVKLVKEIRPEHAQKFLNENSDRWTSKTAIEMSSKLAKLDKLCQSTYYTKEYSHDLIVPQGGKESTRTVAMTREDLNQLRKSYAERDSKSAGRTAIEVSARCGLRAKEIARLSAERINLEKKVIEVREGAKNGKFRDVPIRDKDMPFFADLKAKTGTGRICPVNEDSLNRSIRNEMRRVGMDHTYMNTTIHSIRKLYATERMEEIRGTDAKNPLTDAREREAWSIVQQELGHGSELRMELYSIYVK